MTATTPAASDSAARRAGSEFSLVRGGPLFQLFCRARLSDETLRLVHRRVVAAVLVLWGPLLALSALSGDAFGPPPKMPFFDDIGAHVRFLVVAPLLLLAELIVHRRMREIVEQFSARRLIRPADEEPFARAVNEAATWRNSLLWEVLLLAVVYVGGVPFTLHRHVALGGDAWFGAASMRGGLSPAGLWLVFVSLPLLQFLLLRWYFRLFIWARFLWRVSRLDLDLSATHPDKAAGLGFLSGSLTAFLPIAAAHGALSAGVLADRILFGGAKLTDFKMALLVEALLLLTVFAGPVTVFAPQLARVKRASLRDYGALGQAYVREFRDKWLIGAAPRDELLVGNADIQSLADLGNSYAATAETRLAPLNLSVLAAFVAAFMAPMLPLLLTMMSLEKLIAQLISLVF